MPEHHDSLIDAQLRVWAHFRQGRRRGRLPSKDLETIAAGRGAAHKPSFSAALLCSIRRVRKLSVSIVCGVGDTAISCPVRLFSAEFAIELAIELWGQEG